MSDYLDDTQPNAPIDSSVPEQEKAKIKRESATDSQVDDLKETAKDVGKKTWGFLKKAYKKGKEKVQETLEEIERRREEERQRLEAERAEAEALRVLKTGYVPETTTIQPFPTYQIAIPKGEAWNPAIAVTVISALEEKFEHDGVNARFGIVATDKQIVWTFTLIRSKKVSITADEVKSFFEPLYPTVQVTEFTMPFDDVEKYHCWASFAPRQDAIMEPALSASEIKSYDPLSAILSVMDSLQEGEILKFESFVRSTKRFTEDQFKQIFYTTEYEKNGPARSGYHASSQQPLIAGWQDGRENNRRKNTEVYTIDEAGQRQRYMEKAKKSIMELQLYLVFETPHKHRLAVFNSAISSIKQFSTPHTVWEIDHTNVTPQAESIFWDLQQRISQHPVPIFERMAESASSAIEALKTEQAKIEYFDKNTLAIARLTAEELASFWHLPHDKLTATKIAYAQVLSPELTKEGSNRIILGSVEMGEVEQQISIPKSALIYHTLITGRSGMGKSTVIENEIRQLITQGEGVILLDPHGTLIADLLKSSIPENRVADLIYLDVGDPEYPIPLNPFRASTEASDIEAFNIVMWIFKSLYGDEWSQIHHVERNLSNLVQIMLAEPNATLLDMSPMIGNDFYLKSMIDKARKNPQISRSTLKSWEDLTDSKPNQRRNEFRPVTSRLDLLLRTRQVENMTCHAGGLDFRSLIKDKKIVLVDLSSPSILNERQALSAILVGQFFLSSIALGENPKDAPPRSYLFTDEATLVINHTFQEIIRQIRKFGTALTVATQAITDFKNTDTRSAIIGNVGTRLVLGTSDKDEARANARLFGGDIGEETILGFGRGEGALRTSIEDGKPLPSLSIKLSPPPKTKQSQINVDELKARSREQIPMITSTGSRVGLVPVAQVEAWLDSQISNREAINKTEDEADAGLQDYDDQ